MMIKCSVCNKVVAEIMGIRLNCEAYCPGYSSQTQEDDLVTIHCLCGSFLGTLGGEMKAEVISCYCHVEAESLWQD